MKNKTRIRLIILVALLSLMLSACASDPGLSAPGVTLTVDPGGDQQKISSGVELLVLLTVLSIAPSILVLCTSFTRIVIVLSLLRSAIGSPQIPPNQVLVGLSLIMTFFIMSPVYNEINDQAFKPFKNGQISQTVAFEKAAQPVREFMFTQTRNKDLELFIKMSDSAQPEALDDIPTTVLLPAFIISELRSAFIMGFAIYVPFLIIDLVVSSILLAMGMMMLPPSMISLPFKLLLFVMVDGWYLIAQSLSLSFLK
ncbi:MAG: flagellar type III secretion system pore protein FliP [Anaerolineales bacterium]|nr:flagellar type III secretion system pore protein FliP [Anaerolineales bacterium]